MKRLSGILLAIAGWLATPAVHADEAPLDALVLHSGETLRGRVVDVAPGDHATIVVGSEEVLVSWWEIDRIERSLTSPEVRSSPPPPPEPAPAPPPSVDNGPHAFVHIATENVALLRRAPGSDEFVEVCVAPCDRELPLADTYYLRGNGSVRTPEFRLRAKPGQRVDLAVNGTSWFGVVLGTAIAGVGGVGGTLGVLKAASSGINHDGSGTKNGVGAAVIGLALLGTGFFIVVRSMETDLAQRARKERDAFVRSPTWQPAADAALPRTTMPFRFERSF